MGCSEEQSQCVKYGYPKKEKTYVVTEQRKTHTPADNCIKPSPKQRL
jgi:hypothetical protein